MIDLLTVKKCERKIRHVCFTALLLLISLALLFSSCGASADGIGNASKYSPQEEYYEGYDYTSDEYWDDIAYDYDYDSKSESASKAGGAVSYNSVSTRPADPIADTRKIIRTVSMSLETKDFDNAVNDIISSVETIAGYIENSYVSGQSYDSKSVERQATFTMRVPAAALDSYVSKIGDTYHVISLNTNASDITDTYYDTESRLKSLLTQEERLLAMLEGADELQYMLQIEDKLADVRYRIESYHSTLGRYDKQVAYSTLNISLKEVRDYQPVDELPKTFGQRFVTAAKNSLIYFIIGVEDFVIDFIYALPDLIVLAVVIMVIVLIIRAVIKRRRKKKALLSSKNENSSEEKNISDTDKNNENK